MIRFSTILLASVATSAVADQIKLLDGGSLTGEVDSMDSTGRLVMKAPISDQPLALRTEHLRSIHLGANRRSPGDRDALVTLANGDTLPGDLLSVGPQNVLVETDFGGQLEIPRQLIRAIKVGIRPRELLYAGPASDQEWPVTEEWVRQGDSLVATGRGRAARQIDNLPQSFSLAFDLNWQNRPNFKVYFCSDTDETRGSGHNRYYLQFAGAGFEIKRESDGRTPFSTVGVVELKPIDFPESRIRIELRVDRAEKTILLFFNGKLQGRYYDEIENTPSGDHLIFESINQDRENLRVSNIEIREWDMLTERHRSEDRGDQEGDALIDHEGQRFGGKLLGTRPRDDRQIVLFKSPHYPEALEIPITRVSTMFFSPDPSETGASPWLVEIQDGGRLHLERCDLSAGRMNAEHPLLGEIAIESSALVTIERVERGGSDDTPNPETE